MSNRERQRKFRKRNPGYYGRLHAKRRAAVRAQVEAKLRAAALALVVKPEPLMLPAPVETIHIPLPAPHAGEQLCIQPRSGDGIQPGVPAPGCGRPTI